MPICMLDAPVILFKVISLTAFTSEILMLPVAVSLRSLEPVPPPPTE